MSHLKDFREKSGSDFFAVKIIQTVECRHGVPQRLARRAGHTAGQRTRVFLGTAVSSAGMFESPVVVHHGHDAGVRGDGVGAFIQVVDEGLAAD